MNIKIMAAAAAMWMLAACGSPQPKIPSPTEKAGAAPDTSSITIEGDASEPVNQIAIQAIADLEQYWAQNYPEL